VHIPDPVEARELGARRVRRATAAVAAAAVAGTGLLTWVLADQAAAAQSPPGVTSPGGDGGGGLSGIWPDDHVSPPTHPPGAGSSGPAHASSGGS
jgi:hypothetical protein